MGKRSPDSPCTPQNCGRLYEKCGKASTYRRGCRCDPCRSDKNAKARKRYANDPQTTLARNDRWFQKNKERLREYKSQWHLDHAEEVMQRVRVWEAENADRVRDNKRRAAGLRRARKLATQVVDFTQEQVNQRMAYYGFTCYLKLNGCTGSFDHIDHVKPISKGGPHMLSNLRPACSNCNHKKSARWPLSAIGGTAAA